MSTIVHFEVPAEDVARAEKFYKEIFGWEFEKNTSAGMDYWIISTKDYKGNKGLGGGLYKKMPDQPKGIMCYIDVDDVAKTLSKIESKGGKTIMPQTEIPNVGFFGVFQDPEGNIFALIKPNMMM